MSIKNYSAGAPIERFRIVKFSQDGVVVQGALATDSLIGVVDIPMPAPVNARVDIASDDEEFVEFGGTVAAGDLLTSDTQGRAIKSTSGADRIIGFANQSAVLGDIAYLTISIS